MDLNETLHHRPGERATDCIQMHAHVAVFPPTHGTRHAKQCRRQACRRGSVRACESFGVRVNKRRLRGGRRPPCLNAKPGTGWGMFSYVCLLSSDCGHASRTRWRRGDTRTQTHIVPSHRNHARTYRIVVPPSLSQPTRNPNGSANQAVHNACCSSAVAVWIPADYFRWKLIAANIKCSVIAVMQWP